MRDLSAKEQQVLGRMNVSQVVAEKIKEIWAQKKEPGMTIQKEKKLFVLFKSIDLLVLIIFAVNLMFPVSELILGSKIVYYIIHGLYFLAAGIMLISIWISKVQPVEKEKMLEYGLVSFAYPSKNQKFWAMATDIPICIIAGLSGSIFFAIFILVAMTLIYYTQEKLSKSIMDITEKI